MRALLTGLGGRGFDLVFENEDDGLFGARAPQPRGENGRSALAGFCPATLSALRFCTRDRDAPPPLRQAKPPKSAFAVRWTYAGFLAKPDWQAHSAGRLSVMRRRAFMS